MNNAESSNKWHVIANDPTDYPTNRKPVTVLARMKCKWDGEYRLFEIQMTYSRHVLCTGDIAGWGYSYPYDFDFETDEVLAWKRIQNYDFVKD